MAKSKNQKLKITKSTFLKQIAVETAKMSYPGAMSRQSQGSQIVIAGTKAALSEYFEENFPIEELWDQKLLKDFDSWHQNRVEEISKTVTEKYMGNKKNNPDAISAKFLNTFMHQLMKYEKFRYLYEKLHLPLDRKVFEALSRNLCGKVPGSLQILARKYVTQAYSIDYDQYRKIQKELESLWKSYNENEPLSKECKLKARIELNCVLWIG